MSLDLAWVRAQLPGREVVWYETIDSTMPEAARMAAAGCASGTAVGAEEQSAGQGRHGRKWHSEREAGLYVSVVLRPACSAETLPVVTLALGLAARQAIRHVTGVVCDLRWPNDLLVESKKCGGILVQHHGPAVVAGIGINVNHTCFPAELAGQATSLRMATGRRHSREHLLVSLLRAVDRFAELLSAEGRDPILRAFTGASSYVRGRRVVVEQGGSAVAGTTQGLDPSGYLILLRDDGARELILAGGVRPA